MSLHFLPDSSEGDCCVDVFAIDNMRNVREDHRLAMNESIQNVLLESFVVVLYTLTFTKGQGVVAVGEYDGEQLVLVVDKMTAVDVSNGNLVLLPKCSAEGES